MLRKSIATCALLLATATMSGCGRSAKRTIRDDAADRVAVAALDADVVESNVGPPDASVSALLDSLEPKGPPPAPVRRKFRRGDCKTEYAPRPDRDPNAMCRVAGGTFMYGGGTYLDNSTPSSRERAVPAVRTTLEDFYIDQFEVTAAQAAHFLNAHGNVCDGLDKKQNAQDIPLCVWVDSDLSGIERRDGKFVAKKGQEQLAEGFFSWEGALRYCAWVGKEVPSSARWEYAARHDPASGKDLIYPWGDEWRAHATSCHAPECDPWPDADPQHLMFHPVGAFDGTRGRADGSSPWGMHDAAGGGYEIVFGCEKPNETCHASAACPCSVLLTPGDGAPKTAELRLDTRINDTASGFGLVSVRCALSSAAGSRAR